MFALEEKVVCKREKECESENAKKILIYITFFMKSYMIVKMKTKK